MVGYTIFILFFVFCYLTPLPPKKNKQDETEREKHYIFLQNRFEGIFFFKLTRQCRERVHGKEIYLKFTLFDKLVYCENVFNYRFYFSIQK